MNTLSTFDASVPLCVDLDGTLVKLDTLYQGIFYLIRKKPKSFFKLFKWMIKGRAALKDEVMRRVEINAHLYPYNEELLTFLKERKDIGQKIILVTGANKRTAKYVADYLGIFDAIHASTNETNLFGKVKRDFLQKTYVNYDYAGDSIHDLPIFKSARAKIFVNPQKRLQEHQSDLIIKSNNNFLRSIIKSIRLHQWLKNILIFTPMLLAHQVTNLKSVYDSLFAFIAFGLMASSVYIINDLLDITADQSHPKKRNRSFAAGDIQIVIGLYMIPILIIGACMICTLFLPSNFLFILLIYLILANSYSLFFKQIVGVDIIILTILYVLRILGGSSVTNYVISEWFFAFAISLFLSLALAKRCAELVDLEINYEENITHRFRGYKTNHYKFIYNIGVISSIVAIFILSGYIISPAAQNLYSNTEFLWVSLPIITYWLMRLWYFVKKVKLIDDPLQFAITDKQTYIIAFLILGIIYLSI